MAVSRNSKMFVVIMKFLRRDDTSKNVIDYFKLFFVVVAVFYGTKFRSAKTFLGCTVYSVRGSFVRGCL